MNKKDRIKYLKKVHFDERGGLKVYRLHEGSPEGRIYDNEGALAENDIGKVYIKTENNSRTGWKLIAEKRIPNKMYYFEYDNIEE